MPSIPSDSFAILKLYFVHNHPVISAHSLSFRPILDKTREAFIKLFDSGHSASTAKHTHEMHLLMDAATDETKQLLLADRTTNPSVQDEC